MSSPFVIPAAQLTPAVCGWIADRGEDAVAILRGWKLKIAAESPLLRAIAHLRTVEARRSFGNNTGELRATSAALMMVQDWAMIASAMTEEPVAQIAEELARAVGAGAVSAKAEDLRTQFWFGTLLARGGLRPGVLDIKTRRPDFIMFADGLPLSVEVKRPESMRSAMRATKSGASQIRDYGRPGFIALDLGLALGALELSAAFITDPIGPEDRFRPVFLRQARSISERVRGYAARDKWSRILGLFSYARTNTWHMSHPNVPQTALFIEAPTYELAVSGLIHDTTLRVRKILLNAIGEMAGNPVRNIG